jgi:hypothetical protein
MICRYIENNRLSIIYHIWLDCQAKLQLLIYFLYINKVLLLYQLKTIGSVYNRSASAYGSFNRNFRYRELCGCDHPFDAAIN